MKNHNGLILFFIIFSLASPFILQSFYLGKLGLCIALCFGLFFGTARLLAHCIKNELHFTALSLQLAVALFFAGSFLIHGSHVTFAAANCLIYFLSSFYAYRLLLKKSIPALFMVMIQFVGLSLLPPEIAQIGAIITLFACVAFLFKHKKSYARLIEHDIKLLSRFSLIDAFGWILLCAVVLVLGFFCKEGLIASDPFHPLYELSIGQSYTQSLTHAPDLSYSHKVVRFHFLATRLPLFFADIFNITPLDALYFITPLFLMVLCFLLINGFFILFPSFALPIIALFFMPFLNTIEYFGSIFRTTLVFAPSFFLAFLWMIFALYFLISRSYVLLLFTAFLMLLTKASFFFVLAGGTFLYFLAQREYKKILLSVASFATVFFPTYVVFLSGAHEQMLWIVAPLYATLQLITQSPLSILGVILCFVCTLVTYFMSARAVQKSASQNDDLLLVLASCGLSGMLGFLGVTDIVEGNHTQFYIAAYFPLALMLWYQFKRFMSRSVFATFVCCLILCNSMIFYLNRPFIRCMQLLRPALRETHACAGLIKAYTWLEKNSASSSLILFSKHYEEPYAPEILYSQTGHIRSAVSARQMFCESFNWKGVMMQPDFAKREVDIIKFYRHAVILSPASQKIVNAFFDEMAKPHQQALPLSQRDELIAGLSGKMLHILSGGKEWCMLNRYYQILYEMSMLVKDDQYSDHDALQFLASSGITHVVLELGDQPTAFLEKITKKIYGDNEISIFVVS